MSYRKFRSELLFPDQQLEADMDQKIAAMDAMRGDGAGISESDAVKAIVTRDIILSTYKDKYPFPKILEPITLARQMTEGKLFIFLYVKNGKVVGTASIMPDHNGLGGVEFGRAAVCRENRGNGIVDLLLQARFTFVAENRRDLGIDWFYCTARSANKRIQEIWLKSPHNLVPVGICPYHKLGVQEFFTIFVRHFERAYQVQNVICLPEHQQMVRSICAEFQGCTPNFVATPANDILRLPGPYYGYYSKLFMAKLDDLDQLEKAQTDYIEVLVAANATDSMRIQEALLEAGFIANGFYPAFKSNPSFLSFGRLRSGIAVRAANFPPSFRTHPACSHLRSIYEKFIVGRMVEHGDPF